MARATRLTWAALLLAGCAGAPSRPKAKHSPPPEETDTPASPAPPPVAKTAEAAPAPAARPESSIRAAEPSPASETWGGMGLQEVNEKDWLAGVRQTIATTWNVPPPSLKFSPGKLRAVFVRDPQAAATAAAAARAKKPPRHPPPRRFQIVVVDNQAKKVAILRPVNAPGSDEPPKDVRFLDEERLIYEVVSAPPPPPPDPPAPPPRPAPATTKTRAGAQTRPAKHARPAPPRSRAPAAKTTRVTPKPPAPAPTTADAAIVPTRLFIIQALQPRARPVRCEGRFFAFTADGAHVAFVAGSPEAASVAVDGQPIYPRHGRTVLPGTPAWSKDGHSLAFVETPAEGPARLVLLAEYDNPTGDTTWDLPAAAAVDGARVFWAGAGRLVVGKTLGHPLFSTSFQTLR